MNTHEIAGIVPTVERATHAVALWVERTFPDLGLTQAEAHVLAYLAPRQRCAINDLHRSFGHKRTTLSSLLDRLEARGWLRRAAHPASRRLVLVELTEAGRLVGERVSAAVRALDERVIARCGDTDTGGFLRVMRILEEELSHG
jgi:DNA-binding MarR family transcriptional regulator